MSGPVCLRRPLAAGSLLSVLVLGSPAMAAQGPSPSPSSAIPAAVKATAATLRSQALQGTKAFDVVRSLTVEVGPRPAGSKAYDAAVQWGLRTLKDLGFSNVHAEKATVPHWVRGEESGEIVTPYPAAGPPRGPGRQHRHPGRGDRGAGDRRPVPRRGGQAGPGPGQGQDRLL
ncbi:MAG TPA: hypothetical protein VIA62_19135 [Thermoanaerobaculia bacterium]|nr:hypothetical protein [Thermoanaerobaculia bacterium]